MLYQKLLMGGNPFFVSVGKASSFELHRHPELELSYCVAGGYDIICENQHFVLKEGDLAVISPMAAHEFPAANADGEIMTIEVGYAFLGEFFKTFTGQNFNCQLYKKSDPPAIPLYSDLISLVEETARICRSSSPFKELSIKGNLFKISGLLLQMTNHSEPGNKQHKKLSDIESVDQALTLIHDAYYKPLSVEYISATCGYSKSNFCKIFKAITGDTFHNALNRHRIQISCMLLTETNYSIEKIAQETGFADSKSFCRVFKKFMEVSAGEYRKKQKAR